MLSSATPIFAANTTNTTNLTTSQLAKLNGIQTNLTNLEAKIGNLTTTYKNTKDKGLLIALKEFKNQAIKLNADITLYIKHPTKNADKIIKIFAAKESLLNHQVNLTAKILNTTQNKTGNQTWNKTDNNWNKSFYNTTCNITKYNQSNNITKNITR
jgi:hypothetical protein